MNAAGGRASRGRIVAPLRDIGENGRIVRQPCRRAFGGGIAEQEIVKGELPTIT